MAVIHGFFDESGKQADHPVVAFSGVCAYQPQLESFNNTWNKLLTHFDLKSFHMRDLAQFRRAFSSKMLSASHAADRLELLKPFADCINDHLQIGLISAWDVEGFKSMSKQTKVELGSVDDAHIIAYTRCLMEIVDRTKGTDKISVVCDHDQGTALKCLGHFNGTRNANDEMREKLIMLSFAIDEYFPALQAADMVAWLSRLEAMRRFYRQDYAFSPLLEYLVTERGPGKMEWFAGFADKEACSRIDSESARRREAKL